MCRWKLCHFQYLEGRKKTQTKTAVKRVERREWGWWITSAASAEAYLEQEQRGTSCPATALPAREESPAIQPRLTHYSAGCLRQHPFSPSGEIFGANTVHFMGQLQALRHTAVGSAPKITKPRKCCVETSHSNGLSLKASELFAAWA